MVVLRVHIHEEKTLVQLFHFSFPYFIIMFQTNLCDNL